MGTYLLSLISLSVLDEVLRSVLGFEEHETAKSTVTSRIGMNIFIHPPSLTNTQIQIRFVTNI